jgi:hypothetical protein
MYEYDYTKTDPDLVVVKIKILQSSMTDKNIWDIQYDSGSTMLRIIMENELSSGDKTLLDDIITNLPASLGDNYRLYCNTCTDYRSSRLQTAVPTTCPICSGSDITDVQQANPFATNTSEDGSTKWDYFTDDNGLTIKAEVPP